MFKKIYPYLLIVLIIAAIASYYIYQDGIDQSEDAGDTSGQAAPVSQDSDNGGVLPDSGGDCLDCGPTGTLVSDIVEGSLLTNEDGLVTFKKGDDGSEVTVLVNDQTQYVQIIFSESFAVLEDRPIEKKDLRSNANVTIAYYYDTEDPDTKIATHIKQISVQRGEE